MREIHLTACQYASMFTDGTISIVRGWISSWTTEQVPFDLQLFIVVDFPTEGLAIGSHEFRFDVKDSAGQLCLGALGTAEVVKPGSTIQAILPLAFQVRSIGPYVLTAICGEARGSMTLDVLASAKAAT